MAALIPTTQDEDEPADVRPLDVLFPTAGGTDDHAPVVRGGSAKDLLTPRRGPARGARRADSSDTSRKGSRPRPGGPGGADPGGAAEAPTSVPTGDTARSAHGVSRETPEEPEVELLAVPGTTFGELSTEWIVANTRQPRSEFDEDELEELAESIRQVGVLEPVVVRPIDTTQPASQRLREALEAKPEARYELVMGERRLRATELAGNDTIPAIVRRTDDQDLLRDALLENLHRSNLNPLEEAAAYQQLMADFGATQEELSRKIARSRPQIANTLRLLRLPAPVQRKVAAGVLSAGHARALLALGSPEEMEAVADRIVSEGLSVRSTEELTRVRTAREPASRPRRRRGTGELSPDGQRVTAELSERLDTRVSVTEGATKGRIVIEFAGTDDMRRVADVILGGRA